MAEKPKTEEEIGKIIKTLSAYGCPKRKLRTTVNGIGIHDVEAGGRYHRYWMEGKEIGRSQVLGTYFKMANSGKFWGATKQYLALELDMVEPKVPIVAEVSQRPDVKVIFGYPEDESHGDKVVN